MNILEMNRKTEIVSKGTEDRKKSQMQNFKPKKKKNSLKQLNSRMEMTEESVNVKIYQ